MTEGTKLQLVHDGAIVAELPLGECDIRSDVQFRLLGGQDLSKYDSITEVWVPVLVVRKRRT